MKRTSPIWGSISILTGIVIAVLALVRGPLEIVLLIAVFAAWGLWLIFTQLIPSWKSNREYMCRVDAYRRQQKAASHGTDGQTRTVLLHHVNHRISERLKASYPKVQWEWTMPDPAAFVAYGGTGRIRVYGIPDYDYADVTLDGKGDLRCALVKLSPLEGEGSSGSKKRPMAPNVWYEFHGRKLMESLVADLRSRGHSSMTLNEDGTISIQTVDGTEAAVKEAFPSFPEKVYWPKLAKVLEQEGLKANVQDTKILVSW